jgi:hypothetical protein
MARRFNPDPIIEFLRFWAQSRIQDQQQRRYDEREDRYESQNRTATATARGARRSGLIDEAFDDTSKPLDVLLSQARSEGLTFEPGQYVNQETRSVSLPPVGTVRSDRLGQDLEGARGAAPPRTFSDALHDQGLTTGQYMGFGAGERLGVQDILAQAGDRNLTPASLDVQLPQNMESDRAALGALNSVASMAGAFTPESRAKTRQVEGVRRASGLRDIADETAVRSAAGDAATEPFQIEGEQRRGRQQALDSWDQQIGDALVAGMRDSRKLVPDLPEDASAGQTMIALFSGVQRGDISPDAMKSAVKNAGAEIAARFVPLLNAHPDDAELAEQLLNMIPPALLPSFSEALQQLRSDGRSPLEQFNEARRPGGR